MTTSGAGHLSRLEALGARSLPGRPPSPRTPHLFPDMLPLITSTLNPQLSTLHPQPGRQVGCYVGFAIIVTLSFSFFRGEFREDSKVKNETRACLRKQPILAAGILRLYRVFEKPSQIKARGNLWRRSRGGLARRAGMWVAGTSLSSLSPSALSAVASGRIQRQKINPFITSARMRQCACAWRQQSRRRRRMRTLFMLCSSHVNTFHAV
jgi:hypothetical protein